ncbi:hypothetical protein PIB30_054794 [Stylosanthes scabra]|uniref:DUF4283 domain-containing protein n=1 Tax=Stylosanthes scabra TaxID=79078 RepID=A0ABU6TL86_9FABA|nr:hypothetical protein [Stylosanthes scabra]
MGIWGHPKGVIISDVGLNKVLISFEDSRKGSQISKGGPWNIRGYLLNMHPWLGNKSASEIRTRAKRVNRARAIDGFEFEEYPDNQELHNEPEDNYSKESSEKTVYEKEAKKRESGNLREEEIGVE